MSDSRREVLGIVGRGKTSVVYHGYDHKLQQDVSVKVAHRPMAHFQRAFEIDHPNILPVLARDFDADRGVETLCRPYIVGTSFEKLIQNLRPLSPRDRERLSAAELLALVEHASGDAAVGAPTTLQSSFSQLVALWGVQLASALAVAHEQRFIHQNIKASNILVSLAGEVFLTDFSTPSGILPTVLAVYEKADRFSLITLLWDLVDGRLLRPDSVANLLRAEPEGTLSWKLLKFLQADYFKKGDGSELEDVLWDHLNQVSH